ncbi:hypothetical protein K504DRAFT_450482 [Pleomassaria siparia CBS 279.74]|uniref:Rhodopsin domain-containing protein n=1 Tax=Pleomassaria siparia CBS 279.74 TaxID=1314801 RepID=A0A6G1KMY5_9PLEO|nr:hypothetical protein K504DRAFT_450482 [Pleomassaria siparia CBS 279.74]
MITPSMFLASRAMPIIPDNKSTAIWLATWLLMAIFVIMFLLRGAIKFVRKKKFAVDDVLISSAVIFAIGFSVTMLMLASDGLGTYEILTLRRANAIMKEYYASDFLYILSICSAKLSLIAFFHDVLGKQQTQRLVVQGLGIFILAWTLASLIAVAFQCGLPRPWEMMTLHCYNSGIFWIVYCVIDMMTDVCLIMLPVNLVVHIKVRASTKVVIVACFAPRILVMGAALARLIYLYPITPHDNPEYNLWIPVICTEIQICISILTACIPYMKPFFEDMEAGERQRKSMKVNKLGGYQPVPAYLRTHKRAKDLGSMDSTASISLTYGRTPDTSPRIPSPVPLSPLTPPRYNTPPISESSSSRSPSERGLRLHIPPPDITIRRATENISSQTASSHALSPQLLSTQQLPPSPSRFSLDVLGPSFPPCSHSPRPSMANSPSSSPSSTGSTPPRAPSFSLFPRTKSTQYAPIPLLAPRLSPPIPPVSLPRSRSGSRSRSRSRIYYHQMAANTSKPHEALKIHHFPDRTSSLPLEVGSKSQKRRSGAPTSIARASAVSQPPLPSHFFTTPPSTNPPDLPLPTPPNPLSPQRMRNYRVLVPQNSSRKEQMSPVSPPSATPKTPLTFWRDDSSEGTAISANDSVGASPPWKVEGPWGREPMPIIRAVGRGNPIIVLSRSSSKGEERSSSSTSNGQADEFRC